MKKEFASLLLTLHWGGCSLVAGFAATRSTYVFSSAWGKADAFPLFARENNEDLDQGESSKAKKTKMANHQSFRFATGQELNNLRVDLDSLRHNLEWAEALKDKMRVESLTKAIKKGEARDPDLMYAKALKLMAQAKVMKDASKEEKDALIEKWVTVAASARACLPHFNLEGLWVGK
jgi:hypothetical protein